MTNHSTPKNVNICVFGADWCGYTRKQISDLKQDLKNDYDDAVTYVKCDENRDNPVCRKISGFPQTAVVEGDCMDIQDLADVPAEQKFAGYVQTGIKDKFHKLCE